MAREDALVILSYLRGYPLDEAAKLARLPKLHEEPVLHKLELAVDRLVEAAICRFARQK
jgi:hypothetical protein